VNIAPVKIPSGDKSLRKCIYSVPAQETAEHRAKLGWPPVSDVIAAVTKPRRETRLNLQGCPKPTNISQPLVGRRSSYYGDIWRRYCCLKFSSDCRLMPQLRRYSPTNCRIVHRRRLFASFLGPLFPSSRVQRISDLHSKFALRPHHVSKYGRHPVCDR